MTYKILTSRGNGPCPSVETGTISSKDFHLQDIGLKETGRKREMSRSTFAGSNIRKRNLPLVKEYGILIDLITGRTFTQTTEKEMIADKQLPVETGGDAKGTDLYGTPHIADGIE